VTDAPGALIRISEMRQAEATARREIEQLHQQIQELRRKYDEIVDDALAFGMLRVWRTPIIDEALAAAQELKAMGLSAY
jgi:hypothetical protein